MTRHQRPHRRTSTKGKTFRAGRSLHYRKNMPFPNLGPVRVAGYANGRPMGANRKIGDYVTGSEFDPHAARELELFLMNDESLYRQQYSPIIANLSRKKYRGIYDRQKATKLFMYLMDNGAKEYMRQYGSYDDAPKVFSKSTKYYVAQKFRDDFETEFSYGAYKEYKQKYLR